MEDIYAGKQSQIPHLLSDATTTKVAHSSRPHKRSREQTAYSDDTREAIDEPHFAEWTKDKLVSTLAHRLDKLASDLLHAGPVTTSVSSEGPEITLPTVTPEMVGLSARAKACGLTTISMTKSLQRLYTVVVQCLAHDEPVLLVGDTGCGKTTVVQILALLLGQDLLSVNCHAGTETADFLGSLRPTRNRTAALQRFRDAASAFLSRYLTEGSQSSLYELGSSDDAILKQVHDAYDALSDHDKTEACSIVESVDVAYEAASSMFEWADGPLVTALRNGQFFLLDECSLAEDAVLERLNSVLEPSRCLTLAEKGDTSPTTAESSSVITAARGFRFFATMNPGGDFGKRELSPALRNRFTEVWVPAVTDPNDLFQIIHDKAIAVSLYPNRRLPELTEPAGALCALESSSIKPTVPEATLNVSSWRSELVDVFPRHLVEFVMWFDEHASTGRLISRHHQSSTQPADSSVTVPSSAPSASLVTRSRLLFVTLRDLHQWLAFMAELMRRRGDNRDEALASACDDGEVGNVSCRVTLWEAYCHAACLVLLDGLGLGTGLPLASCASIREAAVSFILKQAPADERDRLAVIFDARGSSPPERKFATLDGQSCEVYGIEPFLVALGTKTAHATAASFTFLAPTTRTNLRRVLRALQVGLRFA